VGFGVHWCALADFGDFPVAYGFGRPVRYQPEERLAGGAGRKRKHRKFSRTLARLRNFQLAIIRIEVHCNETNIAMHY